MIKISECCPNLKSLNVAYCNNITEVGVKEVLVKCKNLRKVTMETQYRNWYIVAGPWLLYISIN